jgi:glycosyltransferase involved in cell wall biosynthesis
MRITIHDFGGYPFTAQLGRELAARGHDVLYLYASGIKRPRARIEPRPDDPTSIAYRGVVVNAAYRRTAGVRRVLQERRYGAALAACIREARPDVVISANCPPDAQAIAVRAAHATRAGIVHWLQDVYSMAVRDLIEKQIPVVGRVIGARFTRLEKDVLRASNHVVCIAEEFVPIVRAWGVAADRVTVVPNWAPLDEVKPRPKRNEWAEAHGLADSPVCLYAGTLGRKHNQTLLARLASAVPAASVVVVSEGTGTDQLAAIATMYDNLRLLPIQPHASVADMLATADVLIALLDPDASSFSVPSKVLTYLAAGRPVLAAMPADNAAARAISESGAGVVVEPQDRDRFVAVAQSLMADVDRRRRMGLAGRAYAEREFQIGRKADLFERVLESAARETQSSRLATGQASRTTRSP